MDLKELKEAVKKIAHNSGAKLVGVGSRERLKEAPYPDLGTIFQ